MWGWGQFPAAVCFLVMLLVMLLVAFTAELDPRWVVVDVVKVVWTTVTEACWLARLEVV